MTGRVVDATTGLPLADITINAWGASMGSSVHSAADGTFSITGLYEGPYSLVFFDSNARYTKQWWSGSSSAESATLVPVQFGEVVTGIDVALVPR